MADPQPPPRDEAFRRLDRRLDALAASSRREPREFGAEGGAGAGYRMLGELVGGVLAGLGLGWLFDRVAGTAPFGLIGGVLAGMAGSIFLVVRSAGRMSRAAQAATAASIRRPAADEDDGGSDGTER